MGNDKMGRFLGHSVVTFMCNKEQKIRKEI